MKGLRCLTKLLMIIGALNWGSIGFFKYDVVSHIFGGMMTMGARVVFALVGLAGLSALVRLFCCKTGGGCGCGPHCNCGCCHKK